MYRIVQDGMPVASSSSLSDAIHYMQMYAQDGPVEMQVRKAGRWVKFMQMRQWSGDDE